MVVLSLSSVIGIECGLIMSDKNKSKVVALQNMKSSWDEIDVAILVICDHPFFIVLPSGNEFLSVLHHIFFFFFFESNLLCYWGYALQYTVHLVLGFPVSPKVWFNPPQPVSSA